ncbi:MAG: outer membrane lipoprotein carrier protein LolA [Phycisphaeraceae bacterium]|nr:outer membrane lipoprotein carrier protein LolA [Phycisphaeraceae bacterium]
MDKNEMHMLPTILLPTIVAATTMLGACSAAGQPAEEAGPEPPAVAEQDEPKADEEVRALLDRIEAASAKLNTLKTRVRYTRLQGLTGDEQRRFGDFYYVAGDKDKATRFAVLFDRLVIDERARPMKTWYIFDGNWLLERDHEDKTAVRRELVTKGAERSDMLNMGEGQLPIPLKLKADAVLKQYKVKKLKDVPFGDQTLHHLTLTPRKGGPGVTPVQLWFDSKTLLLQKIVTEEDGDEIEMLFPTPKLNPEIDSGVFDTKLPSKEDGWQVQEVPIER